MTDGRLERRGIEERKKHGMKRRRRRKCKEERRGEEETGQVEEEYGWRGFQKLFSGQQEPMSGKITENQGS